MEGRCVTFVTQHEEWENSPENSCGSPPTAMFSDGKVLASTSSPKRGRRSIKKRVVSVPIKEVDGSRLKGETSNAPPSDSWAWRKYGQKPIKGSPYPRGYYRCSSSKGCPARKQVERSRDDPNVILVTYSCEHNHPWPATRNTRKSQSNRSTSSTMTVMDTASRESPIDTVCKSEQQEEEEEEEEEDRYHLTRTTNEVSSHEVNNVSDNNQVIPPLIGGGEFGWLSDFECTSVDTMLGNEIMNIDNEIINIDVFGCSKMLEEDELLFADLGELPECSTVFRCAMIQRDEERRTPWCGTTS